MKLQILLIFSSSIEIQRIFSWCVSEDAVDMFFRALFATMHINEGIWERKDKTWAKVTDVLSIVSFWSLSGISIVTFIQTLSVSVYTFDGLKSLSKALHQKKIDAVIHLAHFTFSEPSYINAIIFHWLCQFSLNLKYAMDILYQLHPSHHEGVYNNKISHRHYGNHWAGENSAGETHTTEEIITCVTFILWFHYFILFSTFGGF